MLLLLLFKARNWRKSETTSLLPAWGHGGLLLKESLKPPNPHTHTLERLPMFPCQPRTNARIPEWDLGTEYVEQESITSLPGHSLPQGIDTCYRPQNCPGDAKQCKPGYWQRDKGLEEDRLQRTDWQWSLKAYKRLPESASELRAMIRDKILRYPMEPQHMLQKQLNSPFDQWESSPLKNYQPRLGSQITLEWSEDWY